MKREASKTLTDSKLSPEALDEIVRKATAFADSADLIQHMVNGYTPTLSRRSPAAKVLGQVLENGGLKVFWIH